jgi:hypothetical protein
MPTIGSDGMYDKCGRKYIVIDQVEIKVPWRYNRIMGVSRTGLKTIHELQRGDTIKSFEYTSKLWKGDIHYVLKSIDTTE